VLYIDQNAALGPPALPHLGFKPDISEKVIEGVSVFEDYDRPGEDRVLFSRMLREPDH